MKEYKVGDKVTIKSLDWYNENNVGGIVAVPGCFVEEMSKYCGQETTITYNMGDNCYRVECDGSEWRWSSEMFEEEKTMKYKVGDKVRVKSQWWYDHEDKDDDGFIRKKGDPSFNPEMTKYCGEEATITNIGPNFYYLDIDDGYWCWGDYMLEEVFHVDDTVKIKLDVDNDVENGLDFTGERAGEIGIIKEYDSEDYTYKVHFDEDDPYDYEWFVADWMEKESNNFESDDEESDGEYSPIEGEWIYVSDKYHKDSPREDWIVAKFEEARVKGIDTEYGIWNYFIPKVHFDPYDWEESLKNIYTGKDKTIVKVNG